jgi:TRAP transporter 4TM/12TM fusion protein
LKKEDMKNEPDSSEVATSISPVLKGIITVLATALTLGAILRAVEVDRMVGLVLYTEQYLGFMLAIAIPLVFLAVPAGTGRQRVGSIPWYDLIAALLGFLSSAYVTVRFPVLTELITARPADGIVVGAVMLVLLIEGLRRTAGKVLMIVVLGFLVYALVGDLVPGMLQGRPVSLQKLVYYLAWDSSGVLGTPMRIVTTIVVAFVLFGQILFKSGGSSFFTDIATALMGRFRGGQAKISVFASGLFGSISGSTVSNIATTGVITIPLMKKGGYPPHLAGAIEAVASTGGQLMPPVMGAAAFLMAEFLQVPYTQVVLAAIFPAVLYYVALFIEADLVAARRGITRVDESLIPAAGPVIKSGWFFSLPFAMLIFALFWLNDLPEKAAIRAIVVIILFSVVVGYKGKRFTFSDLFGSLKSTGLAVLDIIMIGAAAGMVIGVLYISGLSFSLTLALVKAAGGNMMVLLVASAIVCIILGMGMPTIGVYLLLATLVAPALIEFGIQPMAAHMFIMYYGMMSMITPPVAIGAFAAATLSGADPMRTGWAAMRFGWVAFVIPFMFIASPTLLMQGNPFIVLIDFFAALAGVFLVSVGVVGYLFRRVSLWERGAFVLSGLALVLPAKAFNGAIACIFLGLFLATILLGRELLLKKPAARWYPESSAIRKVNRDSVS